MSDICVPEKDCHICPRLSDFRHENQKKFPDQFNAPVPSFGPENAQLLIVGLAPGLRGANFTGRPFTSDYAGDLLYQTLLNFGFASGIYEKHINDSLTLQNCRITNAVRCVPPENKPIGAEVKNCRRFLEGELHHLPNLHAILALGTLAHHAVLTTLNERRADFKFAHQAQHKLANGLILFNSYHCSRYNTNTGRLTEKMFQNVFKDIQAFLN